MRAGFGADDSASLPGRDSRFVMYIRREWADLTRTCEAPCPYFFDNTFRLRRHSGLGLLLMRANLQRLLNTTSTNHVPSTPVGVEKFCEWD